MKKYLLFSILFLAWVLPAVAQGNDVQPEAPEHTFGVRFGYSLRLPSTNSYNGQEFFLFEAGHEFSYGAYLNTRLDRNVQFVPYFGLQHNFWPKSVAYSNDCAQDSFPTFLATDDSLPGRDVRLFSLAFEPALRVYVPRLTVFLKFQPHLFYTLRTQIENYTFGCNGQLPRGPLDFDETPLRARSEFNFGLGLGIVKEVSIGNNTGIFLEPGFKFMLSPLFTVRDRHPEGPSFTLYPWGFYLNVGVFR